MMKMMIDRLLKNWAKLDPVALDGIGEYIDHAKGIFPSEGQDITDEKIEEVLKTYTHLLVCAHVLLLNAHPKYRSRVESRDHDSKTNLPNDGDIL